MDAYQNQLHLIKLMQNVSKNILLAFEVLSLRFIKFISFYPLFNCCIVSGYFL